MFIESFRCEDALAAKVLFILLDAKQLDRGLLHSILQLIAVELGSAAYFFAFRSIPSGSNLIQR